MPAKDFERTVKTTILTINPEAIDWKKVQENCCLVSYKLPPKGEKDFSYYARMHNWYKEACDFPCYLHTHGPTLYVKYPHKTPILDLEYQGKILSHALVNHQDENIFHAIVKAIVSDYFFRYETFVSNVDFFLRVSSVEDERVTGLKIDVKQNWKNKNEFFFIDEVTRLRKLRSEEMEQKNWQYDNYYGLFHIEGQTVFKQLKPSQIEKHKPKGIYEIYRNPDYKAKVVYHSIRSVEEHLESRTCLLNLFFDKLLRHFEHIGLPFELKRLTMQRVSQKHGEKMKTPQLSTAQRTIYLVDDRIKARNHSDNFAAEFCDLAKPIANELGVSLVLNDKSPLQKGDWALRIQDNTADDFKEGGVLNVLEKNDPKLDFYKAYPNVVKQTLNINVNSQRREEEKKKAKDKRTIWTAQNYLDYPLSKTADIQMKLEVCLNQLVLKDVVMNRQNILSRFPQAEMMTEKVFIYKGRLVYFDGKNLDFKKLENNVTEATSWIAEKTGRDLMNDILIPSIEKYYFKAAVDKEKIANTLKRRFIISKKYVLEIIDCQERILYEDLIIKERFETLEDPIPVTCFYPQFPLKGNEPFSEEQLRTYETFLREKVKEPLISYNQLKDLYFKPLKDKKTRKVIDERVYGILGIKEDRKLKQYLEQSLGLKFESLRDQTVIPIYQGIWYEPTTRQYLVGSKDGREEVQERGFVFRSIISHNGNYSDDEFLNLLKEEFFPMLEVNFIRYHDYTVYPFPFKLIEMWNEIESL